jgi:transcriptional regulator with XRE-family HTH domain
METLGQRIKLIRKNLKLNQADFAAKIGLGSAVAISNYEKDLRAPDKNKLIIISELGNISLDELLTGVKSSKGLNEDKDKKPVTTTYGAKVVKGTYESEFRVSEALTMCARASNLARHMPRLYI